MKANIVIIQFELNEIQPKDCVGLLFINSDGVYNIPRNLEDVIKLNSFFKNMPQHVYLTNNEKISSGDIFFDKALEKLYQANNYTDFEYVNQTDNTQKVFASTDWKLNLEPVEDEILDEIVNSRGAMKELNYTLNLYKH